MVGDGGIEGVNKIIFSARQMQEIGFYFASWALVFSFSLCVCKILSPMLLI